MVYLFVAAEKWSWNHDISINFMIKANDITSLTLDIQSFDILRFQVKKVCNKNKTMKIKSTCFLKNREDEKEEKKSTCSYDA